MGKVPRIVGIITIVAGAILIIAGGVTYYVVHRELKDQDITVSRTRSTTPGNRSRVRSPHTPRRW